jgi:aminoglycoside phosphotransferase (APT) family kinase protein
MLNPPTGAFNHVFRLGLDTGNDVVARIPFRNAGPRSLLTRSEVATMDFVRSRIGAPVPKVLAWNASLDNEVGCEYIIMEKCEGTALANVLDTPSDSCQHVFDIANLMSDLAAIPFSQYGSIYYKEDLDPLLQERPLYVEGQPHDDCSE